MSSILLRSLVLLFLGNMIGCASSAPDGAETTTPLARVVDGDSAPALTTSNPETIPTISEPEPMPIDTPTFDPVPVDVLLGRIDQSQDPEFVKISTQYTAKPAIYLRKAAYESFEKMYAAAQKDGIRLEIISATRNFNYQKGIWERKWAGTTKVGGKNLAVSLPDPVERARAILRYSSMPGTSRHHWGTDIDLNSLDNSWFESGTGKKVYDWLQAHASEYGYCQTYTQMDESRPAGYQEEKWHWSYMPISANFLKAYRATVLYENIDGFKGAEAAEGMRVIEDYVGGIGSDCRDWK
jgi:LAS superfamily LD-carboxypeptidase LdcB